MDLIGGGGTLGRRGVKLTAAVPNIRRQRSLEWRQQEQHSATYSSSEEDEDLQDPEHLVATSIKPVDSKIFASLLAKAQQEYSVGIEHHSYRSDDQDDSIISDSLGSPYPKGTSPRSPLYLGPTQHSRQASPFPLENTNNRRHPQRYQEARLRANSGKVPEYSKKPTLGRNGKSGGRHHHHHKTAPNALTSSSSATSCNSGSNPATDSSRLVPSSGGEYHEPLRHRSNSDNQLRLESPPEPAPPEVPPRGPSLQNTTTPSNGGTLRRRPTDFTTLENHLISNGDYVLNSSSNNCNTNGNRTALGSGTAGFPAASQSNNNHHHYHNRLQQTQIPATAAAGLSGGGIGQTSPLVMPVFPLRAASGTVPLHTPPHYSPYSPSRFQIDKRCQHKCTWKCLSIALILLSMGLTAMLAYFAAINTMKPDLDTSNCILVQDVKDSNSAIQIPTPQNQMDNKDVSVVAPSSSTTTNPPKTTTNTPPPATGALKPPSWPERPFEMRDLNHAHSTTLAPYQFWNSEFRNKHPTFIQFNFTMPWGANFAVYGRRNVAPSVTQYDFVEFIKGGRLEEHIRRRRDILDALTDGYEAARQILSDADVLYQRKRPIYHRKINTNSSRFDLPHLTMRLDLDAANAHIIERRSAADDSSSSSDGANVSLIQYLETGSWYLSVYNDDLEPHPVSMIITEAGAGHTGGGCPNECSGRGSCYLGRCDCLDGFQGVDCAKSICPVLCSGHGQYGGGVCHCEDGWKGLECDVPESECRLADCSGHGACLGGHCHCAIGWKGEICDEIDCPDPNCGDRGACVNGQCYCKAGWTGPKCDRIDEQVHKCLPTCSDHGVYDLAAGKCACNRHWAGQNCERPLCNLECGLHGRCESGKCRCEPGWTGPRCEQVPCDNRCQDQHGHCRNGTCICAQGWNGQHCTLPGCENGCSGHGRCILEDEAYKCVCIEGWAGYDCSIALEMHCNDDIDNDNDGMIDCSDSECCSHPSCSQHIMCLSSNDPVEVLLRKQPPAVTATFYQRVKFLIEENSVQSYAHMNEYTESEFWNSFTPRRVAVMRGQVLTPQGLGIVGIRVSVDRESKFGFTLTRQGGWFDVLVNGGGAVTLQFQRSPFKPLTRTVYVPWNQIVVLAPVYMELNDDDINTENNAEFLQKNLIARNPAVHFLSSSLLVQSISSAAPCPAHNPDVLRPFIISSWRPDAIGGAAGKNLLFAETQIVQESITIPRSNLHLIYRSSQATGYLSTVQMRLTGSGPLPDNLTHVHARVEIEGSLYVKTYEADPDLIHTFAWNKRNVYKQKVYGVVVASIAIGYQYRVCSEPVWETATAHLNGFDVDISDIGGWNLDVHHHYNFHEGILQKGDGTTLHFKQYPRRVEVVVGNGQQRALNCPSACNGLVKDAQLLNPVALTTGPDGSIYVGDFNLIRRIVPDTGTIYTILELKSAQIAYQYYLTVSPADGYLYISDPEKHQILRVLSMEAVPDPVLNSQVVVGTGERCIPGDETQCGDEGPALLARLSHPKGLVIAADGTMYIGDGTNIRAVDPQGLIHTLIGNHGPQNRWVPIPCRGALPAAQIQLQWPTVLSLSPLDSALYFIDDRLVLKLTVGSKVELVAGVPLHCHQDNSSTDSNQLGTIVSLGFSPDGGDLYIAEVHQRNFNAIRTIHMARSDPQITHFAGTTTSITNTSDKENLLASNVQFQMISALSISPSGVLYVADQGTFHILSLAPYLPVPDDNGEYHIPDPYTDEIYVFNRYGQHIVTRDLTKDKARYQFLYSKNTSFGKLSTVTDSTGNKIQFLRDYSNAVSSIENTQDHKSELKMSGVGNLIKFSERSRTDIDLEYDLNTGLLTSRTGAGETFIYKYDSYGRVSSTICSSGEAVDLKSSLTSINSIQIDISSKTDRQLVLFTNRVQLLENKGHSGTEIFKRNDSIWSIGTIDGTTSKTTIYSDEKHPLLEMSLPIEAELFPIITKQVLSLNNGQLENHQSTHYRLVGDVRNTQQRLNRAFYVNGTSTKVLEIEFDQFTNREFYYDGDKVPLLKIVYDSTGQPVSMVPFGGTVDSLNISYDSFNRINAWKWGTNTELKYTYNSQGLLSEITSTLDGTQIFTYNEQGLLMKITLASQKNYILSYDNDGGLKQIILPSGTKHLFNLQATLGFIRVTYTAPGSTRSYLQHFTSSGQLLQTIFPGDGARIVYRYKSGRLVEVIHGDGTTKFQYGGNGVLNQIVHMEQQDFEYTRDVQYLGVEQLLQEERYDYNAKSGLSSAKFTYDYDPMNLRVTNVQGRIGGQNIPVYKCSYDRITGRPNRIGSFTLFKPRNNGTRLSDGTAVFTYTNNGQFHDSHGSVTIHGLEVFRMEFVYDIHGRIVQSRTFTRNMGVNSYTNAKNYTWDCDGQLLAVEAQEPWAFRYDDNGNMLTLTYRGNTIPMEYGVQDRITKFGEGQYRYDSRGMVVQNARDEKFLYNAKGLLVRAVKRGRFDVRYFYDHLNRLTVRKDNFGNVTQFFYTNPDRENEVNYIYSPRDGKLMTLTYDDRGRLIYAQVYRHKYYVATDQCGTPLMVFNQYGEGIREIMRSPYGHIVYDSNPYLYLPVDYCGGLLDQVTSLVHMPNGRVYDPLIGQWMTPLWEGVLQRVTTPTQLHLYRFNGNDPINVGVNRDRPHNAADWLRKMGYALNVLLPQSNPTHNPSPLPKFPSISSQLTAANCLVQSGYLINYMSKRMTVGMTGGSDVFDMVRPKRLGSTSDPPFGRGILVTTTHDHVVIVNSVPSANEIYRDVYTSVFNRSRMVPFTFLAHGGQQDVFYFVKEDTWRVTDDRGQLKRLQGQVNTTFHEISRDLMTNSTSYYDVKLHGTNAIINLRYGTTIEKEKQRLLHHAKLAAVRKIWHRERELAKNGFLSGTSLDWSSTELEELIRVGSIADYEGEYKFSVDLYPELAEDPYNVRLAKKTVVAATPSVSSIGPQPIGATSSPGKQKRRRRRKRDEDLY